MSYIENAKKAALEAGALLLESRNKIQSMTIRSKQNFDYVTQVDIAAEQAIIEILKASYPDHGMLAEETGALEMTSDYRWIIDPLDGTTNYIHGYPVSAVSIALEKAGEILLGVVYDPFRNEMFWAEKGQGAFLNESPIHVSAESTLEPCLIATGFPFKLKDELSIYLEAFQLIFKKVSGMRRAGAAAIDLAYVACGRVDGFWESLLKPWDMAAGSILVREAGGMMSDFSGTNQYFTSQTVVASNGRIHQALLDLIQKVY